MGVDETGKDMLSRGIDHFRVSGGGNIALNARDRFAFAKDIRGVLLVRGNDFPTFDQK
jgi:hypothetical protein